ncbi:hypothetical protein CRV04_11745 [Candidatus Marinarcus aquaticus]|uniref:ABC-type transport auxiliary lipoprotein component domain-containing protein n=2 Tax=Candidatus Marinarcus aquaticus TaxID=2044504 RepID=A0A4Q0XME4_9BACT|nr:hypothetical protein CRV04_11745 [Candidatus Marinarcus aquaticus]
MVQESKMKHYAILLILLLLTGCSVKNSPTFNTYAIDFHTQSKTSKTINKTIFINQPYINGAFATKNIFYTTKAYEYDAYAKNRWIDFPSSMLQLQLTQAFAQAKLFKHQSMSSSRLTPDIYLNTVVNKMYHLHERGESYAMLSMSFELIEKGNLLLSKQINRRLKCKENTPYGYVQALNEVLKMSIEELIKEVANTSL